MRFSACIAFVFLLGASTLAPAHGWAQQIAAIDFVKLHQQYKAYDNAKQKMHQEVVAQKKQFDDAVSKLDNDSRVQLQKDSIGGGKQRSQIVTKAHDSRALLESNYLTGIQQRTKARSALMKEYEEKIHIAIRAAIVEGGYTQVRSTKEAAGVKATDITDLVLQKLNQ